MKKKLSILIVSLLSLVTLSSCDGKPLTQEDFVNKMFGSWQSLVIQLTSTLILFVIVGIFVFKPVRKILQTRQDYVVSQVKDAEAYKEDAKNKQQQADERIASLNDQAKEIIDEANKNAAIIKDNASKEMDEERIHQKELLAKEIEQEKVKAKEEIRKEIVNVALDASKAILEREVTKSDNDKIVDDFIKEVESDE
jgi:F-type H+-transporting ATPase subunit b